MIYVNKTLDLDFDNIDIDPFWNVGNEREHKNHRIHAYPAKFPAFITQKALEYARQEEIDVKQIVDIFCGCGTVAFEAKRNGIDFWGCDINPVAVLIAKAKSHSYKIEKIEKYYEEILSFFDNNKDIYEVSGKINERIKYWFFESTIKELSLLKHAILETIPESSKYRFFYLCAFSNILKPTSKWLTKSIKPQLDPQKEPTEVRDAFVKQCTFMKNAIKDLNFTKNSKVIIQKSNALKTKKEQFADLIITSPPYVTSYEYADLHQLSSLWLDFADDYRTLRKDSVGSNYNVSNIVELKNNLFPVGRKIVDKLEEVDKSKADAVAKYFYDMQQAAVVCYRLLHDKGAALMVIGNTEYKGVKINNAKHLVESLYQAGFESVFITKRKITNKILTPYRDKAGKFSSDENNRKVYSEEFIVVGRKE